MGIRLEWNKGAPEKLEPGMALLYQTGGILIIGSATDQSWIPRDEIAWSWIVKPHDWTWLEAMAKAHGVGR